MRKWESCYKVGLITYRVDIWLKNCVATHPCYRTYPLRPLQGGELKACLIIP